MIKAIVALAEHFLYFVDFRFETSKFVHVINVLFHQKKMLKGNKKTGRKYATIQPVGKHTKHIYNKYIYIY